MITVKRLFTFVLGPLFLFMVNGCSGGADCFEKAGDIIEQEYEVGPFDKILVNEDIEMVVSQGEAYKVVVQTGENLIKDFRAEVENGKLVLTMDNTCEILRGYNNTIVFVTAPDLKEIVSSTQFEVRSEGVLNYENLSLKSFTFSDDRWIVNGEFKMEVNVANLDILANELANFEIRGNADYLKIRLTDGHVRAYMPELVVRNVEVLHRSSLDITINPTESVSGELLSTGDLILVNEPPVVEVTSIYKGQVIVR